VGLFGKSLMRRPLIHREMENWPEDCADNPAGEVVKFRPFTEGAVDEQFYRGSGEDEYRSMFPPRSSTKTCLGWAPYSNMRQLGS